MIKSYKSQSTAMLLLILTQKTLVIKFSLSTTTSTMTITRLTQEFSTQTKKLLIQTTTTIQEMMIKITYPQLSSKPQVEDSIFMEKEIGSISQTFSLFILTNKTAMIGLNTRNLLVTTMITFLFRVFQWKKLSSLKLNLSLLSSRSGRTFLNLMTSLILRFDCIKSNKFKCRIGT